MTFRVLVSDALAQEGVDVLQSHSAFQADVKTGMSPGELKTVIGNYDGLVIRSATKVSEDVIACASKLKVIGRAGVGVDNIDLNAATNRGIIVMNTPGGNTTSTAELTWAMIASLARKIPAADASMKAGKWDQKKFTGSELFRKTLGIIGLGRVGTEVGKRALAFHMNVLAYDPFVSKEQMEEHDFKQAELDQIFEEADFITVHTTKTKETTHLINDQAFAKMKKGVRIINCARGGIVDEEALLRALESKKCAGAAIDAYETEPAPEEHPLRKRDDCISTPHLASSTDEAEISISVEIAENIIDALLDKEVRNAINIPSIAPEVRKKIGPYIGLAEKIGMFASQYLGKHIDHADILYAGPISNENTTMLTIAVLKGLLTPVMDQDVNYVNAPMLAEQRKIEYSEIKEKEAKGYSNLITVKLTSNSKSVSVSGTNFGADPRIVAVDDCRIEIKPTGFILFIKNVDQPGVVGHLGNALSQSNINIADMSLGRQARGGEAITMCNIDAEVPDNVLNELSSLDFINEAKVINLK